MALNPREWATKMFMASHILKFCIITISAVAVTAQAAVLRFNPTPGENSSGISFDGPVEATIVQSAAGMDIIIPGVTFTLECQGDPTDSCKVSVDSSSLATTPPTSSTVDQSDTDDNSSSVSDEQDCSGLSGFGSQYAGACDGDNVADGSQTPTESAGDDTSDDPNSGYDLNGSNNDSDGSSNSSGWSLNPSTGSGEDPVRVEFPASDRVDYSSTPDLGSGGAQAGGLTYRVWLGLKTVTVLPLTMSSTPVTGGIGFFQPSSTPTGSDFAMWVSTGQDGDPIPGCEVYGGFDGKLRVSTETGGAGCVLQPGATYYVNAAACVRGDSTDYQCRRKAQTGYEAGYVLLSGDW